MFIKGFLKILPAICYFCDIFLILVCLDRVCFNHKFHASLRIFLNSAEGFVSVICLLYSLEMIDHAVKIISCKVRKLADSIIIKCL